MRYDELKHRWFISVFFQIFKDTEFLKYYLPTSYESYGIPRNQSYKSVHKYPFNYDPINFLCIFYAHREAKGIREGKEEKNVVSTWLFSWSINMGKVILSNVFERSSFTRAILREWNTLECAANKHNKMIYQRRRR